MPVRRENYPKGQSASIDETDVCRSVQCIQKPNNVDSTQLICLWPGSNALRPDVHNWGKA